MVPQVHPELLEQRVRLGRRAQPELEPLELPAQLGLPGQMERLERLVPAQLGQLGQLGRLGRLDLPGRRGKVVHFSHFWQKLRQR